MTPKTRKKSIKQFYERISDWLLEYWSIYGDDELSQKLNAIRSDMIDFDLINSDRKPKRRRKAFKA